MQMAGHIIRLPHESPAKYPMTWIPDGGRRKRGWP